MMIIPVISVMSMLMLLMMIYLLIALIPMAVLMSMSILLLMIPGIWMLIGRQITKRNLNKQKSDEKLHYKFGGKNKLF